MAKLYEDNRDVEIIMILIDAASYNLSLLLMT